MGKCLFRDVSVIFLFLNSKPNNILKKDKNVISVLSLNPYMPNWCIKVRCTNKGPIRHYTGKNNRSDGKVCSVDLLDKDGTEIVATMFNAAVDKFYDVFGKDKLFYIEGGRVQVNENKKYSHIKNDYRILLNEFSTVCPTFDDNSMYRISYNFMNISSIEKIREGDFVDIIGIVIKCNDLKNIISKKHNKCLSKRTFSILDKTGKIDVSLWGTVAEQIKNKFEKYPIVAFKACSVSNFNGKTLSSGSYCINPNVSKTAELQLWLNRLFSRFGDDCNLNDLKDSELNIKSLTKLGLVCYDKNVNRINFGQLVNDINFNIMNDLVDKEGNKIISKKTNEPIKPSIFFDIKGKITAISHSPDRPPWYKAATEPDSNGFYPKVIGNGDGTYLAASVSKIYNSYVPRYILRFCVSGFNGQKWMTAFHDVAEIILGVDATIIENHLKNNELDKYSNVFNNALFKTYIFRVKARKDCYQDSDRTRYDVVSITKLDIKKEIVYLKSKIKNMIR